MTYRWDLKGVPRKGWKLANIEDLGDVNHTCQLCGNTEVRFVHYLEHPEVDRDLAVGCVCAGHITGDYKTSELKEKRLRDIAKWCENWQEDEFGMYKKYRKKTVGVYRMDDRWFGHIDLTTIFDSFDSVRAAQEALFDLVRPRTKTNNADTHTDN